MNGWRVLTPALAGLLLMACGASSATAQQLENDAPPCTKEATKAAIEGAKRGDAASLYLMGRYTATGKCLPNPPDDPHEMVVTFYQEAAKRNYPPAFYNLGRIAAADHEFREAEQYWQKGTDLGHRGCELQLGILYSWPTLPEMNDDVKAFAWLSIAASRPNADPIAAEALSKVRARLKPADLAKAEALHQELNTKYGSLPEWQPH
jgi:TPR repeat protein